VSFHWVAAALLSFGITYLVLANQIILDPWSALDAVNSRTLPQIYGLMLCLAVLVLWMQRRHPTSQSDRTFGTPAAPPSLRLRPLLLLSTLILGFIVALNWLNLWVAVGGLVLGLLWVMQERRWSILIGASLALPIGGFLLVERLLQMSLPIS
jgi:4-hydroxybenzoate polyprenyltransferase